MTYVDFQLVSIRQHPTERYALICSIILNDRNTLGLDLWKEPIVFSTSYDQAIQQNLYILATNDSDPTAPRDREVKAGFSD